MFKRLLLSLRFLLLLPLSLLKSTFFGEPLKTKPRQHSFDLFHPLLTILGPTSITTRRDAGNVMKIFKLHSFFGSSSNFTVDMRRDVLLRVEGNKQQNYYVIAVIQLDLLQGHTYSLFSHSSVLWKRRRLGGFSFTRSSTSNNSHRKLSGEFSCFTLI